MTSSIRSYLYAALTLAVCVAPAQAQRRGTRSDPCRNDGDDDRYERYCDTRTIGWRGNGRIIAVDAGPNGGVTVSGWERDSVDVTITVHARARTTEDAQALAGQVRVSNENGVLHATGPMNRRGINWWVSYDLMVPTRSDLTLETENGPVGVDHVSGVMDLRAENGPITLDEIGGNVRARLQNGPLRVTLAGNEWQGERLDAETVNGPLVLRVPDGYNAELETGTVNGPMDIGMPITVQGRFGAGRQRIHTTLGRGGRAIRVVTTNGPASVQRIR